MSHFNHRSTKVLGSSGTCLTQNPNYLFASVAKFGFTEVSKIEKGFERSLPIVMLPRNNIEENLKICRATFHVRQNPLSSYTYLNSVRPFSSEDCTSIAFRDYRNSGYQTSLFASQVNTTGAQIKMISFTMNNLNTADNNVMCSSFSGETVKSGVLSSFLESQMLQNTSLFSKGSFYLLDQGASTSVIYQNITGKFQVTAKTNAITLDSMQSICTQGCVDICYDGSIVKSIPIMHLDSLNVTAPNFCKIGFSNITVQRDGCYVGSSSNDIFNITAKSASITSRNGIDLFKINNIPGSNVTLNDFELGVDKVDLSAFSQGSDARNAGSGLLLNITEHPTAVNLPNNQRLNFLNIVKSQLNSSAFTPESRVLMEAPLQVNDNETSNNQSAYNSNASIFSSADSNASELEGSNYAYFWLLAIPVGLCAVAAIGAGAGVLAYKYMHRGHGVDGDKSLDAVADAVTAAGGMVAQEAIEFGRSAMGFGAQDSEAVTTGRFSPVQMPAPTYSPIHSPVHSPAHSAYHSPVHSPRSVPAIGGGDGLSIEFPAPSSPLVGGMIPPLASLSLPPLHALQGVVPDTEF